MDTFDEVFAHLVTFPFILATIITGELGCVSMKRSCGLIFRLKKYFWTASKAISTSLL
ncbi:MAG: hypothetical protein ACFFBD_25055 [Candidatus Hodarchaeota archaeon]